MWTGRRDQAKTRVRLHAVCIVTFTMDGVLSRYLI